jgi:hypothetical protein
MANNLLRSIGLVSAIALIPAATAAFATVDVDTYRELDQFMNVFERVRAEYVEQVDDKTLLRGAIDGMLASLDPHSSYLDEKGFQSLMTQTDGEYGGLGLNVTMEDGAVKVIAATEDTPAQRAGIKAGDYITHINGKLIYGGTLDEAVDQMRGPPGTAIKITIVRPGRDKPFDVPITRAIISLPAVKWEIKDRVGILNVNSFNKTTTEATLAAMTAIEKSLGGPPLGYVLDLRSNPGGLLDQAIDLSDAFLQQGEIVSQRGRQKGDIKRFGVGDRRRRVAGPSSRASDGRAQLRQGIGPDVAAALAEHRAAADDGALLHAVGPLGAGRRHRARHRRAAALRRRLPQASQVPRGRSSPPPDQRAQGRRFGGRGRRQARSAVRRDGGGIEEEGSRRLPASICGADHLAPRQGPVRGGGTRAQGRLALTGASA